MSLETHTLKFPTNVGGQLFPTGTRVRAVNADDAAVRELFPGISPNDLSPLAMAYFPNIQKPVVVTAADLVKIEESPK